MNIKGFSWRSATRLLVSLTVTLFLITGISNAEEMPVPTNIPNTITADVTPGMQMVELPFALSGVDGLIIEVIVPVDDAFFTLLDPAGNAVLLSAAPEVNFTAGSDLSPGAGLPGGVFVTQEVNYPDDGTWTIHLEFPPAIENTVIVATISARTSYQAGIAIARESYLTGEDASIGMLIVNEGLPVTGLTPNIEIFMNGSTLPTSTMIGLDNGINADGLADDGVYSIDYTFPQAGDYLIKGSVNIATVQGTVHREASRIVSVTDPPVTVLNVSAITIPGAGGCVVGIEEVIDLNVSEPGEYIARGTLTVDGSAIIEKRAKGDLAVGENALTLYYPSQEIMKNLGDEGPYAFKDLDILYSDEDNFILVSRNKDVSLTQTIGVNSLCREPIEIGTGLTVDTVLDDGYIDALVFGLPINVQVAGNYQVSVKVVGANGEDIELVGFTEYLATGSNTASFSLPADRFQTADGPYAVISALVIGPGGTAQLARVGESPAFQRWQFSPVHAGDLDNDGDVDSSDRNFIIAARNTIALSPGDRRDIVRDGRIDLRDARAILRLR